MIYNLFKRISMSSVFENCMVAFCDLKTIITLILLGCTIVLFYFNTKRCKGLPPGPRLFPVVGNLPNIVGGDILRTLRHLRQIYGDIFSLYIGNELTIFLNGYDVIHDALVKKGSFFANRPLSNFQKKVIKVVSVIFANGSLLKEQKSLVQRALHDLCFRNDSKYIETIINMEASCLVNALNELDLGKPVSADKFVNVSVANVIFRLVYKHRFDLKDEYVSDLLEEFADWNSYLARMSVIVNCFPFLTYIPGDLMHIEQTEKWRLRTIHNLNQYIYAVTESNEKHDSLAGLYIQSIQDNKENDIKNSVDEQHIANTCLEVIAAGSETTSSTLRWLILYLVRHPEVQKKMFEEIAREIGRDKAPTLNDRERLPYVNATVLEGLRIAPTAPLAVPHTVTRDLKFHGYVIPENCSVIINIDSCTKDAKVWENPNEFLPERFLDTDGTICSVPKELITFSLGQRSCPGKSLAKMELFLFLTTLVQRFEFLPAFPGVIPEAKGVLKISWCPEPYLLKITKR